MIAVVLLGGLVMLGVISIFGRTVDTRDTTYALWPLERPKMSSNLVMVPRTERPKPCSAQCPNAVIARPTRWPMTDQRQRQLEDQDECLTV